MQKYVYLCETKFVLIYVKFMLIESYAYLTYDIIIYYINY